MAANRVLILGQAKTGTTALYYAVKRALPGDAVGRFETPVERLNLALPHLVAKLLCGPGANPSPALVGRFDRTVALLRDPRDRLISVFLFRSTRLDHLRTEADRAAFVALLRAKEQDPAGLPFTDLLRQATALGCPDYSVFMSRYSINYAAYLQALDGLLHRLRYEDLVAGRLAATSDYLGLPLAPPGEPDAEFRYVARSRATGGWRRWFTPADVERLRPLLRPSLLALGYDAEDWALAPGPLPPAEGSDYVARLFAVRWRDEAGRLAALAQLPA